MSEVKKCEYPEGVDIKFGPISIDPCRYEIIEKHQNCTVEIVRCVKCGYTDVRWYINKPEEGDFAPSIVDDLEDYDEDWYRNDESKFEEEEE